MAKTANNTMLATRGVFFGNGASSFKAEDQSSEIFTMDIANVAASATDKYIAILNGDNYTKEQLSTRLGISIAGIVTDGTIVSTAGEEVTGAGSPGYIEDFVRMVRRNPRRMIGLSVDCTDTAQLSEAISIYRIDPTIGTQPTAIQQIIPRNVRSNTQQNDKLVHIPLAHLQFDADTVIVVKVKKSNTLTLSWALGAYASVAETLQNEALKEWEANPSMERRYSA